MKIELIKDHVLGEKGDIISVSQPRGDYLIRMGVAKKHVATVEFEQEEKPKPKPKKETKPKTKTKK
jgi:dsDNA-specific endonuclease/ATPase MutS2